MVQAALAVAVLVVQVQLAQEKYTEVVLEGHRQMSVAVAL
jgi:hypothetical protein